MNRHLMMGTQAASGMLAAGIAMLLAGTTLAHCDTSGGPVIPEARAALEKGDVTPLLKWVGPADEAEVKAAFAKAVAVRTKGDEAKDLADRYFIETLVRLHRAGEGAPFTGIRDEPVKPIVALADKALADGSADAMVARISGHLSEAVKAKFARVAEAAKHKDESIDAGRAYVEAYVAYMHYIEGIHAAVMGPAAHHAEAGGGAAAHRD